MIILNRLELQEKYNLPSGNLIPVDQFNRVTGWNVTVNEHGYFWATNKDFGDVEGCLQSSVTATHQYVLTDFMKTVKFVYIEETISIDSITPTEVPLETPTEVIETSIETVEVLPSLQENETVEESINTDQDIQDESKPVSRQRKSK